MSRFIISSKNGSGCKLNHSKQEVIQPSPDTHHQFIHIWSYSENLKFCSLNLDSPQNLGLDASWTIPIRGGYLTYSSPIYPYQELQWKFKFFLDLDSPQNLSLDASWTIQIGGGHLTYSSPIYPYWELQWKFSVSLFGSRLSSKFGSRHKLNHPNRRRSPYLLLVSPWYSRSHQPNQPFSFTDSWSPQKMGLATGWTIQIGGGQISNRRVSVSISCFTA